MYLLSGALAALFSAELNHLCNFDRGHQEEISGDPPVQWSETIYALLKEGIMGNIHVKLYEIKTCGSGGNVI